MDEHHMASQAAPDRAPVGVRKEEISDEEKRAIQDRLKYCFRTTLVGKTHDAIADHLGVSRITVTKWLRRPPVLPSPAHLLVLARRANISPSWLLLGIEPMLCSPRRPDAGAPDAAAILHELAGAFLIGKGVRPEEVAAYRADQGDAVFRPFYFVYAEGFRAWWERGLNRAEKNNRDVEAACLDEFFGLVRGAVDSGGELTGLNVPLELVRRLAVVKALRDGTLPISNPVDHGSA
jgi:Homeodomain-like domain-containing protein